MKAHTYVRLAGRSAIPALASLCLFAATGLGQVQPIVTTYPTVSHPGEDSSPAQASKPCSDCQAADCTIGSQGNQQAATDPLVVPVDCRSCGGLLSHFRAHRKAGTECYTCTPRCYPGSSGACDDPSLEESFLGRLFGGFYEAICCPDPCYEPQWIAAANAAFFADSVRPKTQMRIRWDSGFGGEFPDRAEFFWARADGNGKGPGPKAGVFARNYRYRELTLYTEAAAEKAGLFFEIPYRSQDVDAFGNFAGFADISLGTKSVLLDSELLQVAFQFRTVIPTGSPGKGLSTGHVTLEPALLAALKLAPDTYLQAMVADAIPVSGDPDYAGDVVHYHLSLNHVIWRPFADVQVVALFEFSHYIPLDGAFTDTVAGAPVAIKASDLSIVTLGPGIRLVICDRIDFGLGTAFAVTGHHWADDLYRVEFRWRY